MSIKALTFPILLLPLLSCHILVSEPTVFVANCYNNGGQDIACYWRDGRRFDLESAGDSQANAITLMNGDVYTAGFTADHGPCYWKNGARTDLGLPATERATAIDFRGGEIVLGLAGGAAPHYWLGYDRPLPLPSGATSGTVNALLVHGERVYCAGQVDTTACIWIDGAIVVLDQPAAPSRATGLFFDGGILYVSGSVGTIGSSGDADPYFWTYTSGGFSHQMVESMSNSNCYSLSKNGDTILTVGSNKSALGIFFIPVLWTTKKIPGGYDTSIQNLPSPAGNGVAHSVIEYNGDVFIAGVYQTTCCYWKNGERIDLTEAAPPLNYGSALVVR